jgi:hypothetical protein
MEKDFCMRIITSFTLAALFLITTGAHAESLCFDEAGAMYGINPLVLRAIAKVESDFNSRAINWNTNGTYDFGVMQINSSWASTIGKDQWNRLGNRCSNIRTGAMILSGCMKKYGYTWEAIGCYNSQTPDKRDRYAMIVFKELQHIERQEQQLKKNFEATGRSRVDDVVTTSRNGQRIEYAIEIEAGVPVLTEAQREQPHLLSEERPVTQGEHGMELSASSVFEVGGSGI